MGTEREREKNPQTFWSLQDDNIKTFDFLTVEPHLDL